MEPASGGTSAEAAPNPAAAPKSKQTRKRCEVICQECGKGKHFVCPQSKRPKAPPLAGQARAATAAESAEALAPPREATQQELEAAEEAELYMDSIVCSVIYHDPTCLARFPNLIRLVQLFGGDPHLRPPPLPPPKPPVDVNKTVPRGQIKALRAGPILGGNDSLVLQLTAEPDHPEPMSNHAGPKVKKRARCKCVALCSEPSYGCTVSPFKPCVR